MSQEQEFVISDEDLKAIETAIYYYIDQDDNSQEQKKLQKALSLIQSLDFK